MSEITLGKTYRDIVTGFVGVAMVKSQYLTGCDTVGLCPKVGPDGKVLDWAYFDQSRVEETGDPQIFLSTGLVPAQKGGPHFGSGQRIV